MFIFGISSVIIGIVCVILAIIGRTAMVTAGGFWAFARRTVALIVSIALVLVGGALIYASGVIGGNDLNRPTVSLSQGTATIEVGQTLTLTVQTANTNENVVWSSDNTNVVAVSNGTVTGTGVGTAKVTATAGSAFAACIVTVTEAEPTTQPTTQPVTTPEPEATTEPAGTDSDAINPDYALLVSDVKLMLDDGATDSEITTTLVSSGKTEAEAAAVIADARNLKGTVDGLVDNGLLSSEQANDVDVLIQFAQKTIRHAYTVTDWDDLEMGGVFELVEYGQAFSQAKNIKGDINTVGGNLIVLVWGDNVTINGTNLGRSVTLVYPDRIAQLEIVGGGIRPFATTPTQSAYHWEARLLADASIKMGGGTAKYRLLDDGPEPADGIVKEFDGVSWVENPQKPGEFMLPEEAMGTEVLVKFGGTAHFGLNAVKIADADGNVIYEILAKNSTEGKDFYGNSCKVDAGVPQGWTVEYSRDGRILGIQGNGYLLVKNGATYWPGFYEEVFKYAQ